MNEAVLLRNGVNKAHVFFISGLWLWNVLGQQGDGVRCGAPIGCWPYVHPTFMDVIAA